MRLRRRSGLVVLGVLLGAPSAFAGGHVRRDAPTTYGHRTPGEPPWIASVRFTLAELDAKARRP